MVARYNFKKYTYTNLQIYIEFYFNCDDTTECSLHKKSTYEYTPKKVKKSKKNEKMRITNINKE